MNEKYFILSVDYSSRVGLEYMSNRLYYVKEMSYEEMLEYEKELIEKDYEDICKIYNWEDCDIFGNKEDYLDIRKFEDGGDSCIIILNEKVDIDKFCKNNYINKGEWFGNYE